jgi:hypothetical protein
MGIFVYMDMLPDPVVAPRRYLFDEEFVCLGHCLSYVVHALLRALVFREGSIANSVETGIFGLLFKSVQHSLDVVNKGIIAD